MQWLLASLLALIALLIRIASLRRRPEIWWLAFTVALAGIIGGTAFMADESGFNQSVGVPNLAYLLACLSFLTGGGAVTVYVHTLRRPTPSTKVIGLIVGAVLAEAAILVLLWTLAPVHTINFGKFRAAPLTPLLVAYEWVFHTSMVPSLVNVAVCAFTLARATPVADHGRRIGLLIIAFANGLVVLSPVLYLVRASTQHIIGDAALRIASAADLITLVAAAGIATGTSALLLVPQLLHRRRLTALSRTIRPLWRRTLDLYPEVGMPGAWRIRARKTLQTERMLIEIADALRLLPVPTTAPADPYDSIARSLLKPRTPGKPQRTALAILPAATSRLDEEEQVLELARRYKDLAHAS